MLLARAKVKGGPVLRKMVTLYPLNQILNTESCLSKRINSRLQNTVESLL